MRTLFWNTHKNININAILSELIIENNISIAVLAEYEANLDELIQILLDRGKNMQPYLTIGCDRIKIIGSVDGVVAGTHTDYMSMQIIDGDKILCCIHLTSQIYSKNEQFRNIVIQRIITDIEEAESTYGTEKTIVVGDFNINPYDSGCTGVQYFNSVPIYSEAKKKTRTVAGQDFSMFYNPMWNLLGDATTPYGTYYHSGSDTYWNMYDQVIIRPALRDSFIDDSLRILTETSSRYLLNRNGHPDKKVSDHLPIVFEIKEENYG